MSSRISASDGKKVRVLLISEDPVDSRWLKQLLGPARNTRNGRQRSFVVNLADRIDGALENLTRHHFDAILVDLGLPASDDLQPICKIIVAAAFAGHRTCRA